jgi:SAM-dependent methyltransferase
MRYQDIDWNEMWRQARAETSWRRKQSHDWDRRAASFARRNMDSPFVRDFLSLLRLEPDWRVLDVGCGPGTLSIPLARQGLAVTALDYSAAMLAELEKQAASEGLRNLRTVRAAWEDDWQAAGIPRHEVAIASRSLAVDDLAGALGKLDQWASRAVYIADRVGSAPFDPELFAAVGREFRPGPDYIFTVNILYRLGIQAHVDFITLDSDRLYATQEEALDSCRWMLEDLTPDEEARLRAHVEANITPVAHGTGWRLRRRQPLRWALIWWRKE